MDGLERVIARLRDESGIEVGRERAEAIVRENGCDTVDAYFAELARRRGEIDAEGFREGEPTGKFADENSVGWAPPKE